MPGHQIFVFVEQFLELILIFVTWKLLNAYFEIYDRWMIRKISSLQWHHITTFYK